MNDGIPCDGAREMDGINMLTPSWLREHAKRKNATWLPILAQLAPTIADALEIADGAAQEFIENHYHAVEADGFGWFDIADCSNLTLALSTESQKRIGDARDQAVRYLETRGLLIRHADRPELVRFKEEATS
jgi:hypothetical protein